MARSVFATRPRQVGLLERYLSEPICYGGEVWARGAVMLDRKRAGMDDRCVDRYLQGAELRVRLHAEERARSGS